jgi:hypothetical protein
MEHVRLFKVTQCSFSKLFFKKTVPYASQIKTFVDSYLTLELRLHSFDFIVSVMSLHHLSPAKKTSLYMKLRQVLVPSADEESKLLKEYRERMKSCSLLETENTTLISRSARVLNSEH